MQKKKNIIIIIIIIIIIFFYFFNNSISSSICKLPHVARFTIALSKPQKKLPLLLSLLLYMIYQTTIERTEDSKLMNKALSVPRIRLFLSSEGHKRAH